MFKSLHIVVRLHYYVYSVYYDKISRIHKGVLFQLWSNAQFIFFRRTTS